MKKLSIVLSAVLLAVLSSPLWISDALTVAQAQTAWNPGKNVVKAIIPFAPGGGTDQAFRHFQKYAETKGVNLVPVYKAGAEGLVGQEEGAKSPADGLHIMFGTIATMATHRVNYPEYRFQMISLLRGSVMTLITHPNSGINSIEDLERELRKDTKTTKVFAFGAPGQKMALEQLFKHSQTRVPPTMIAYKGGAPVVQDILGAHIDIAMVPMAIIDTHVKAGKIRVLGITSDAIWPAIAQFTDLKKRYPAWENDDGFLVSLPQGSPPETNKFWSDFIQAYLKDPQVIAEFQKEFTTPDRFGVKPAEEQLAAALKKAVKK